MVLPGCCFLGFCHGCGCHYITLLTSMLLPPSSLCPKQSLFHRKFLFFPPFRLPPLLLFPFAPCGEWPLAVLKHGSDTKAHKSRRSWAPSTSHPHIHLSPELCLAPVLFPSHLPCQDGFPGTHRSCQTKHSRLISLSSSLFLETFN